MWCNFNLCEEINCPCYEVISCICTGSDCSSNRNGIMINELTFESTSKSFYRLEYNFIEPVNKIQRFEEKRTNIALCTKTHSAEVPDDCPYRLEQTVFSGRTVRSG